MYLGDADVMVSLTVSKRKKKLVIEVILHQKQEIRKKTEEKKNFSHILF